MAEVNWKVDRNGYYTIVAVHLQHHRRKIQQAALMELLSHIPEIQAAASLLLESKMFYVPFVLNSASIR
ncbi:Hormone receptor 4 [Lucilia cuprina]|nr:Hormone receptor 4 [Lucilia cuprina]